MTSHVRGLQDPTDAGEVDAGIFDADMPGRRISTSCEEITVEPLCDDEPECRWAWRKNKCKTRKNRRLEDPTDAGAVDAGIFDDDTPGRRLNARDGLPERGCKVTPNCKWRTPKNKPAFCREKKGSR